MLRQERREQKHKHLIRKRKEHTSRVKLLNYRDAILKALKRKIWT